MFKTPGQVHQAGRSAQRAADPLAIPEARRTVWRGPILWLIICGSLLIAALVIGTAVMVYNFRERALNNAERELENTAFLLASHFDQQLDDVGVVERDLANEIRSNGITSSTELTRSLSGLDAYRILKAKMSAVSYFGTLNVFNAEGILINSSDSWPTANVNIADRSYFKDMKSDPQKSGVLSDPLVSRVTGVLTMVLLQRLTGPNGEFLGVIGRGIEPAYFGKFFASLRSEDGTVITMTHRNGIMLARHPQDTGKIGQNSGEMSLAELLGDSDHVTQRLINIPGEEDRIVAARTLSNFPLAIFASTTMSSALASWREQTRFLIIAAALAIFVIAVMFWLIIQRLVEQHLAAQRRLILEKQRLGTAVDNMTHGLTLFDSSGRLVICNQRYLEMYGVSPEFMTPGRTLRELLEHRKATGSYQGDVDSHVARILEQKHSATSTVMQITDGRWIHISNRPVADGGWVTTHEDITDRRRSDERIAHLAHYDALTDLPNRVLFGERLEQQLKEVADESQLAVFYIDLDGFKGINDSLGHSIGDELLKTVATRLSRCVHRQGFVARLGGDEFAVVQTGVRTPDDVQALVTQILQAIREPCECQGHELLTDASVGIAISPKDGTGLDQLLKNADLAMYEAKSAGRRIYRFFEPGMDARVNARRTMELDLRQAIAEGQFELHYQPSVEINTGRIAGCEALLRWKHPQRGMISPVDFIPVAEDTGMINPLGEWVLATACAEAANWPDEIRVAVNVSPVQLRSPTLALKIAGILAASNLSPHRLEIEITEAVFIHDDEEALAILHQLRSIGVRIALDDFGVGYSSLSYLQRFPFDKIKIDRCFIRDVDEPDGSSSIVQAVTGIAAARNIITTAEGVETKQQLEVLRSLSCTEMQGFLFSPAKPAMEIRQLFIRHRAQAAPAA